MPDNSAYYAQFGWKAAKLSFAFPGLGQLHNKQYYKGTVVVSIFSFSVLLLLFLILRPGSQISPSLVVILAVLPPVVWAVSIFDAYHTAIENRKRDSTRYNVQIVTTIRGYDSDEAGFEEITVTKNVSRLGACIMLSRELIRGSQVSLEFEGNQRVTARVVWARETGNSQEHLVGMELLSPLKQFE